MGARAVGYAEWAITYVRTIITVCLAWFASILEVLDMEALWTGAVVFAIVFSVILLPMRGGSMLGGGMLSDIAGSRIRSGRREARSSARANARKHLED